MKRLLFIGLSLLPAIFYLAAQSPEQKDERDQVLALVKDVQKQQAQIVTNQEKIDTKLAEVAEEIRMARLFSSRGR